MASNPRSAMVSKYDISIHGTASLFVVERAQPFVGSSQWGLGREDDEYSTFAGFCVVEESPTASDAVPIIFTGA